MKRIVFFLIVLSCLFAATHAAGQCDKNVFYQLYVLPGDTWTCSETDSGIDYTHFGTTTNSVLRADGQHSSSNPSDECITLSSGVKVLREFFCNAQNLTLLSTSYHACCSCSGGVCASGAEKCPCGGTAPTGAGIVLGPAAYDQVVNSDCNYLIPYAPTSWTPVWNAGGRTAADSCVWGCAPGYVRAGSACVSIATITCSPPADLSGLSASGTAAISNGGTYAMDANPSAVTFSWANPTALSSPSSTCNLVSGCSSAAKNGLFVDAAQIGGSNRIWEVARGDPSRRSGYSVSPANISEIPSPIQDCTFLVGLCVPPTYGLKDANCFNTLGNSITACNPLNSYYEYRTSSAGPWIRLGYLNHVTLQISPGPVYFGVRMVYGPSACEEKTFTFSAAYNPTLPCGGTPPSGAGVVLGASTYVTGYTPTTWTHTSSASPSGCQWTCQAGYIQDGSACSPLCGGTPPSGPAVTMGPALYSAGYSPTAWTYDLVASAATPCKWKCDAGYEQNGSSCSPAATACGGTRPSGAGVVMGPAAYPAGYGVTSWTYNPSAGAATPCQWACAPQYSPQGSTCVIGGTAGPERPRLPETSDSDKNYIDEPALEIRDGIVQAIGSSVPIFFMTISCSNTRLPALFNIQSMRATYSNFNIYSEGGKLLGYELAKVDCNVNPVRYMLVLTDSAHVPIEVPEKETYYVTATIDRPCSVCARQTFAYYGGARPAQGFAIPDNSVFLAIAVLAITAIFVSRKRI